MNKGSSGIAPSFFEFNSSWLAFATSDAAAAAAFAAAAASSAKLGFAILLFSLSSSSSSTTFRIQDFNLGIRDFWKKEIHYMTVYQT